MSSILRNLTSGTISRAHALCKNILLPSEVVQTQSCGFKVCFKSYL